MSDPVSHLLRSDRHSSKSKGLHRVSLRISCSCRAIRGHNRRSTIRSVYQHLSGSHPRHDIIDRMRIIDTGNLFFLLHSILHPLRRYFLISFYFDFIETQIIIMILSYYANIFFQKFIYVTINHILCIFIIG